MSKPYLAKRSAPKNARELLGQVEADLAVMTTEGVVAHGRRAAMDEWVSMRPDAAAVIVMLCERLEEISKQ